MNFNCREPLCSGGEAETTPQIYASGQEPYGYGRPRGGDDSLDDRSAI